MNIPFCGSTYQGRSTNINASRSVNLYPELSACQEGEKSPITMVGTPGTRLFASSIGGHEYPLRGMYTFDNRMFAVIGNEVYEIDSNGTGTELGTITSWTGQVDWADNGVSSSGVGNDEILLVDGFDGYIIDTSAVPPTVTKIVAAAFPNVPTQCEFIDGYFVVIDGSMAYHVSDLYDGLTWNALAFASVAATSDSIRAVINHRQQLFFLKEWSTEVWYDAGTPTSTGSPFLRQQGAVYDYGIAAPWSIAKGGTSFYFLCNMRTQDGGEIFGVAEVTEYSPVMISTPAISYKVSQSSTVANCFGYCYVEQGHIFYVLTNPDDDWTIVYDAVTKMWHERSSFSTDFEAVKRHLGNCYTFCNGKHYLGDYRTSRIYEMSSAYLDDDGSPIYAWRSAQTLQDPNIRNEVFITKLTVDAETGIGSDTPVKVAVTPYKGGWIGSTVTKKGAWSGVTTYVQWDYVTYSGVDYVALQGSTNKAPDIYPAYWALASVYESLVKGDGSITGGATYIGVTNPQVTLFKSYDGGHTWGSGRSISMGAEDSFYTRLVWRQLGRGRDVVFKLGISDAVKRIFIAAYVEASA